MNDEKRIVGERRATAAVYTNRRVLQCLQEKKQILPFVMRDLLIRRKALT